MKLEMKIGENVFAFQGDAPFEQLRELAEAWLTAIAMNDPQMQGKLDALVARLKHSNDALSSAVDSSTQP